MGCFGDGLRRSGCGLGDLGGLGWSYKGLSDGSGCVVGVFLLFGLV